MAHKKEAHNEWSFLNQIMKLIKSEVTTTAGKVNLTSDLILAGVVVAIFTANALERITIAIVSIWNNAIIEYLSDASTLVAFAILVGFFVVCLAFLFFFEKILSSRK